MGTPNDYMYPVSFREASLRVLHTLLRPCCKTKFPRLYVVNSSTAYNRFRFTIQGLNDGQTLVSLPELRLFGTQV